MKYVLQMGEKDCNVRLAVRAARSGDEIEIVVDQRHEEIGRSLVKAVQSVLSEDRKQVEVNLRLSDTARPVASEDSRGSS